MTIEEVIKKYAKENGYSGLYNADGECGCSLDDDSFKDCTCHDCEFGYVTECVNCEKIDDCELRKNDGCDMCIRLEKPKSDIAKAYGLADATCRTHKLGINPGGEIQGVELDELPDNIDYAKVSEKLLSKKQLKELGIIS